MIWRARSWPSTGWPARCSARAGTGAWTRPHRPRLRAGTGRTRIERERQGPSLLAQPTDDPERRSAVCPRSGGAGAFARSGGASAAGAAKALAAAERGGGRALRQGDAPRPGRAGAGDGRLLGHAAGSAVRRSTSSPASPGGSGDRGDRPRGSDPRPMARASVGRGSGGSISSRRPTAIRRCSPGRARADRHRASRRPLGVGDADLPRGLALRAGHRARDLDALGIQPRAIAAAACGVTVTLRPHAVAPPERCPLRPSRARDRRRRLPRGRDHGPVQLPRAQEPLGACRGLAGGLRRRSRPCAAQAATGAAHPAGARRARPDDRDAGNIRLVETRVRRGGHRRAAARGGRLSLAAPGRGLRAQHPRMPRGRGPGGRDRFLGQRRIRPAFAELSPGALAAGPYRDWTGHYPDGGFTWAEADIGAAAERRACGRCRGARAGAGPQPRALPERAPDHMAQTDPRKPPPSSSRCSAACSSNRGWSIGRATRSR